MTKPPTTKKRKVYPKFLSQVSYKGRMYQFIGVNGSNIMGDDIFILRSPKTGKLITAPGTMETEPAPLTTSKKKK